MDADISGEYVDDDKPYQTEGDGEIGTFESGSQDNGTNSQNKSEKNHFMFELTFDLKLCTIRIM